MMKLVNRQIWRLDFVGHGALLCGSQSCQADLDLCLRFHHTPKKPIRPGLS